MSIPIINAKDIPLNQGTGTVPNVSGAMRNWFQTMTFEQVTKSVVNFKVVETKVSIDFMGVVDQIGRAHV